MRKLEKKDTSLTTIDIVNKMIEVQMLKIDKFQSAKADITEESELAMQNMIELLKFKYEMYLNSEKK